MINRVTLGMNRLYGKQYPTFVKWRLTDVCFLVVVFLLNIPVSKIKPFERQFYINDLSISHPYASTQRVNDSQLMLYCTVVPIVVIIIFSVLFADSRHKWYICYTSVLSTLISVNSTAFLTDFLKNWIGRLRPDFLARCIPKEGVPLDTLVYAKDVCTNTNMKRIYDGFRTTPSGHSSESFAGLGFLYLWLCGQLMTESPRSSFWRKSIALVPLVGAAIIALSRTQDYRHHFVDVLIGSCLGFVMAWWVYRRSFPSIFDTDKDCYKPYLDDSEVSVSESPFGKPIGSETAVTHFPVDQESLPLDTRV